MSCTEAPANCGTLTSGPCVSAGHYTCTILPTGAPAGWEIYSGMTYDFYSACLEGNGGPSPQPVSGGKTASNTPDPDCTPAPNPTPPPHNE